MTMEVGQYYRDQSDGLEVQVNALKRWNKWWIIAEILCALGMIAAVVFMIAWTVKAWMPVLLIISLLLWVVLSHLDQRNSRQVAVLQACMEAFQCEALSLSGDYSHFPEGEEYVNTHHEYSFDLDVFGKSSLFNRIARTVTLGGSNSLARSLAHLKWDDNRPEALLELSHQESFLTRFKAQRILQGKVIDTGKMMEAIQQLSTFSIPSFFTSGLGKVCGFLLPVGFLLSVFLSVFAVIPWLVPVWWGIIQLVFVFSLCSRSLKEIEKIADNLGEMSVGYADLVELITKADFHSVKNRQIQSRLKDSVEAFKILHQVLTNLASRANLIGLLLFDLLFLSDFQLIRKFAVWQHLYADRMREWVDAVSEMDALVSMATVWFNHPEGTAAEVVDSDDFYFEAHGLYHPFLGTSAIRNDFDLKSHEFVLVTGANMAGKSTFLRTIGINVILAFNAMPVFASSLKLSRFRLFSSMRTSDDLTHGISFFNAELLRLQQLISYCKSSEEPTLILLDEILKGTNSLDKLNGSKLFLQAISRMNVSGVIATHDLELSKLANEYPETFRNVCFEIKLGTDITYSYRITPGVARNQNATYLLKQILKDL
ncbi:MAG: DNA mismatch repair protein MutS [Prevotella sp.]|jgi:ABC-type multidrug transport system fused ATPase/permease subunit|nr:DNA mismatch repair protein MutS [Prevotella sp.]MCI2149678.1 DNA mismatch repair protein MutS [Prevotella sp.]